MTTDGRQGAYGRPRQKVMINAGRGHVIWHLAKTGNLEMPVPQGMPGHLGMPATSEMPKAGTDVRTRGNGYKNGLDFIITLVVVNFRIVHLLHRLILVILS